MLRITTTCTRCRCEHAREIDYLDPESRRPSLPSGWKVGYEGHLLLCAKCVGEVA